MNVAGGEPKTMRLSDMLMVVIPGFIVLRAMAMGIDPYAAFVEGARSGAKSAAGLLGALCAMSLLLGMMQASGLTQLTARLLQPLLCLLRLPMEVTPVLVLRPLTGSGSLKALEQIIAQCGVDSRAARVAAVLMGSSETVFYTTTVYLAATDVRRLPHVIPVSLIAYLAGAAVAGLVV